MENNNLTPEQEQELINKIEEKINNLGKWETHLDLMRGKGVTLEKSYTISDGERQLADEKKKLKEELSELKKPKTPKP